MITTEDFLSEVSDYCRQAGLAESTFGRLAVNDGKFVSRIRDGGRGHGPFLDSCQDLGVEAIPLVRIA